MAMVAGAGPFRNREFHPGLPVRYRSPNLGFTQTYYTQASFAFPGHKNGAELEVEQWVSNWCPYGLLLHSVRLLLDFNLLNMIGFKN